MEERGGNGEREMSKWKGGDVMQEERIRAGKEEMEGGVEGEVTR